MVVPPQSTSVSICVHNAVVFGACSAQWMLVIGTILISWATDSAPPLEHMSNHRGIVCPVFRILEGVP
jgi:hypothetical protein